MAGLSKSWSWNGHDSAAKTIGGIVYVFGIKQTSPTTVEVAQTTTGSLKTFSTYHSGASTPSASRYGSMWVYDNDIYAAHNNDGGVWKIVTSSWSWTGSNAVQLQYTGPSLPSSTNDGLNCPYAYDPYKPPPCAAGTTGPNGGPCVDCASGTYKPTEGDGSCTNCPSDSSSAAGSTASTDCQCNAGYTGPGGACTACGVGTYKEAAGDAACSSCPAGTPPTPAPSCTRATHDVMRSTRLVGSSLACCMK